MLGAPVHSSADLPPYRSHNTHYRKAGKPRADVEMRQPIFLECKF